jgi:hypothetical protein
MAETFTKETPLREECVLVGWYLSVPVPSPSCPSFEIKIKNPNYVQTPTINSSYSS